MNSYLQFTLRELLFVVAFAALGLASLANGGVLGAIVVSLGMIVTMCLMIIAFVGRRSRQAFAIGFLVPVVVYSTAVLAVGRSELDPYEGKLPASKLLRPMFAVMAKKVWINMATGEAVGVYDPAKIPSFADGHAMLASSMTVRESLNRQTFMSLGHLMIAMMLGYAGAKFAVIVHRRESKDNEGRAGECKE